MLQLVVLPQCMPRHPLGGCSRGVMVKALDCGIVVCKFELQSCRHSLSDEYPWESYEPPYPPSMG